MSPRIQRIVDWILKAAVVAVALAIVYFVLDHDRKTRTLASILIYYAAPTALLAGLLLILRARPEVRANVAVLMVFTIAPLYAIEGVIQIRQSLWTTYGVRSSVADEMCPRHLWNRQSCLLFLSRGDPWDARTAVQVYKDRVAAGEDVLPSLDAMHLRDSLPLEIDARPILAVSPGASNVNTILCNEYGDWLTYRADERGFNNPPGLHVPDSVTVAVVGDSFVHGWCVPEESGLVAGVRAHFPRTLNLGFHGAGPLTTLGTFREYAVPLRPDIVVWMYFDGNDQQDLRREQGQERLARYLEPGYSQNLSELQPGLDASLRDWIVELQELDDEFFLDRQARRDSVTSAPGNHPVLQWLKLRTIRQAPRRFVESRRLDPGLWDGDATMEILRRAKDDVESWGGTFVIGILPDVHLFLEGVPPERAERMARFDELGVTVVDFLDVFQEDQDPASAYWPYVPQPHYNEAGYSLIAEVLSDTLRVVQANRER